MTLRKSIRFILYSGALLVAFAILMTPEDPVQILIVALLVHLVALRAFDEGNRVASDRSDMYTSHARFLALRTAAGHPPSEEELETQKGLKDHVPRDISMDRYFAAIAIASSVLRILLSLWENW